MRSLYIRFICWLSHFESYPTYSRPLAGLHQLLWVHFCGWGWRHSWHMAMIYWKPRK